jgi:hypothetical protein
LIDFFLSASNFHHIEIWTLGSSKSNKFSPDGFWALSGEQNSLERLIGKKRQFSDLQVGFD